MRLTSLWALFEPRLILLIVLVGACAAVEANPAVACRLIIEQSAATTDFAADYEDDGLAPAAAGGSGPIFEVCSVQVDALREHPWAPLLARDIESLTLADLQGIYQVADLYAGPEPVSVVDFSALGPVMATLDKTPAQPVPWWERMVRWVYEWLRGEEQFDAGWLKNISISATVAKFLLYGSLALIVLLALGVIATELRHLRLRRRAQNSRWDDEQLDEIALLGFDQLESAPLRDQPGLLLGIILSRLEAIGALRLRASFTHRDITTAVISMEQGEAVGSISRAAERATFGDWHPAREDMTQLLRTGRRVCNALDGSMP